MKQSVRPFAIQDSAAANAERRRAALRSVKERLGLSINGWSTRAGLREGTLRNFMSGKSEGMNIDSYEKLAAAVGLPVSQLLGEPPVPGDEPRLVPLRWRVGRNGNGGPVGGDGSGQGENGASAPRITVPPLSSLADLPVGTFAALVADMSAGAIYPAGCVAIAVPPGVYGPILPGRHVIAAHYPHCLSGSDPAFEIVLGRLTRLADGDLIIATDPDDRRARQVVTLPRPAAGMGTGGAESGDMAIIYTPDSDDPAEILGIVVGAWKT